MAGTPSTATLSPSPSLPAPAIPVAVETEARRHPHRRTNDSGGTKSGIATAVCFALADVTALATAAAVGYFLSRPFLAAPALALLAVQLLGLFAVVQLFGLRLAGLQRTWGIGPVTTLSRIVTITAASALFLAATLTVLGHPWQLLIGIFAAACSAMLLVPAGRSVTRSLFGRRNWWGRRVFIVGSDKQAVALYTKLLRQPQRGLRPVGFVDDLETLDPDLDPTLYLGPPDALHEFAISLRVNAAIVAKADPDADTQRLFCREELGIRDWILMSALDGYPSLWGEAVEVADVPALWARNRLLAPGARTLKRWSDLAITSTGVLLGLPIIATMIGLVWLSSPGPVFYCNKRIGRHGRRFMAWKFRTMVVNAEEVLEDYLASDPLLRAEWEANCKLKRDPRITWIGHFLRQTSLDELPQLWNVLRGEMSLVGPRPILESEIEKYAGEYEYYVDVLPGITGLWQVSGRNNTTYQERIAYVAYYVKNWSFWLDLYILISTIRVVLFREGAY